MPRMTDWASLAVVLVILIAWLAPQQLSVIAYKGALLALAAVGGYALDRSLFPYARPHNDFVEGHHMIGVGLMLRRAIIVAAVLLSVGLAL